MSGGLIVHGSAVAFGDKGCLITGASGTGKSSLALELMALGGALVADDRCDLCLDTGGVWISAPPGLPHAIEARGVGLLAAPLVSRSLLELVVDLDKAETSRLPESHSVTLLGRDFPCLHNPGTGHFAFAIRHYLLHGVAELSEYPTK